MLKVVGIVESVCVVRVAGFVTEPVGMVDVAKSDVEFVGELVGVVSVAESVVEAGYVTIVEESRLIEVFERVEAVVEVL